MSVSFDDMSAVYRTGLVSSVCCLLQILRLIFLTTTTLPDRRASLLQGVVVTDPDTRCQQCIVVILSVVCLLDNSCQQGHRSLLSVTEVVNPNIV